MIAWNTQGGRVYPQSSILSRFVARLFRGIPQNLGVGAWKMAPSEVNPLMSASEVNPIMTALDTVPIMTGADL